MLSNLKIPGWWWLLPAVLALTVIAQSGTLIATASGVSEAGQRSASSSPATRQDPSAALSKVEQSWPKVFAGTSKIYVVTEAGEGYTVSGGPRSSTEYDFTPNQLGSLVALGESTALVNDGSVWYRPPSYGSGSNSFQKIPGIQQATAISTGFEVLVLDEKGQVFNEKGKKIGVPDKVSTLVGETMVTDAGELYSLSRGPEDLFKVVGVKEAVLGCGFDEEDAIVVDKDGKMFRWRNFLDPGNLQVDPLETDAPVVQIACKSWDNEAIFYAAVDAEGNGYEGSSIRDVGMNANPSRAGEPAKESYWAKLKDIRGATDVAITAGMTAFVMDGEAYLCASNEGFEVDPYCEPQLL